MKLPEPICRDDTEHGKYYCTLAACKQAIRDALEEAAKQTMDIIDAQEIRAMKDEIK